METALKSQLNKLKLSQKSQPILPSRSEASFLFDLEHSKRIDIDTIYEIGYSGLIDLARHKGNFVKYFNSIFNSTSKYFNRETKRAEELKQVDEEINELIVSLIPYFRHKPTHKILEYLIRIYNINVYNKKILFLSFLPYHETKLFSRLIQIINFDQFNHLKFFSIFAKEGKVVLKEFLYKEISTNFDLFREILNFYEESVLTNKTMQLDDSAYFNFIFDICDYLINNSAKAVIDVNRLNLIIQFVNRIFKFFKNKMGEFNRFTSDDEGDYEIVLVKNLCRLINTLIAKLSINAEYKKAFVNDLVNKVLIHSENKASIDNILISILQILVDSSVKNKNSKDNFTLFGKEALNNLMDIYDNKKNFRQILRNISDLEELDLTLLVKTIMQSSSENMGHMSLVKNLIRDNNFKEEHLKNLILFIYDRLIENMNDQYVMLLNHVEEIHSEKFNSILVDLLTKTKDKNQLQKLQEITSGISNDYKKLLTDGDKSEINAFNLFLNLNQTNVNTVLNSIKKLNDIYEVEDTEQREYLMTKIVPSLANKFSFLDKEIILEAILNLKHLSDLINSYPLFRTEFVNFFFTVNEKQIELYSAEFLSKYVSVLVSHLKFDKENDSQSLKVIIYLILFKYNNKKLFDKNDFASGLLADSTYDSLLNYLFSHSEENTNSIIFMEIIKELVGNLGIKKVSNIDLPVLFTLIEKILNKEKENCSVLSKTNLYKLLEIVVAILNKDFCKSNNSDCFKVLSKIFIDVLNSITNIQTLYANQFEMRKIFNKYTNLLLSSNNTVDFDNFIHSVFSNTANIQIFFAHTILNSVELKDNFYQYILNKLSTWDFAEASLISAVIFAVATSKDHKLTTTTLDIINRLNNKKLHSSSFNLFLGAETSSNDRLDKIDSEALNNLVGELLSRRNEILVNTANVKKLISAELNENFFESILLLFVKDANILNLNSISRIIQLFSCSKTNKSHSKYTNNLVIIKSFVDNFANDHSLVNNDVFYQDFIKLTQLILENFINFYKKSALNVIEIIQYHSNKFRFDQTFIEKLFNPENFELSAEIKLDIPKLHKIVKVAISYSIPSESFISYDDQLCKNLLDYILRERLILNRDNEYFIFYTFEIIFKSKNYYFDLSYVKITAELLYSIHQEESSHGTNSDSNTVYLNLSNNLLTIITNSTIESEEKKELKSIIDRLEQIIFNLVRKFRNVQIEISHSLELAHVINTLFLCINKLVSFLDFIKEEKEYVKNLIIRCLEILNEKKENESDEDVVMVDLTQKTKEEVYLVFLNAIKNFIELIFSKRDATNTTYESERIFYEYIHYFVKFSIFNIQDEKILELFLTNFVKISMIEQSENFLACYFVNLYYFTIDLNQVDNTNNIYSNIISNFFRAEEDESQIKTHMCKSLKVIQRIFEELNRNNEGIFCLESEDIKVRPDPNFISLNLINKIFVLIENNLGYLEKSNDHNLLNTILKICDSLNTNRKLTTGKMRKNENSSEFENEIYKIHLKELKSLEKELFSALNESKIIYNAIMLIYENKEEESKNMRGYLLNKFYEITISQENFESVNVSQLFEYFMRNIRSEDKVENLQLIFSILTKIINGGEKESKEVFRILKQNNNFDYILSLVKFSDQAENNSNLQIQFYHFSIIVFLTKIFNSIPANKFLDKFNQFLKLFMKSFDVVLSIGNEDLTILILETFDYLSRNKSEFFSPILKEILYKIPNILNKIQSIESTSRLHQLVNKTFEIIAKKQLFDDSFKAVKHSLQSFSKSEQEPKIETYVIIFNFFKTSIEQLDKVVMADMYEKIFKFFVKLLIDEKMNRRLSYHILDCFRIYVLKINEKQLRTIFQNILIFGKEKSEEDTSLKYKLENSIVTFQILNTILQAISFVFVPYFEKYKGYFIDLINSVCSIFSTEDKRNSNKKKKSRVEYDESYDDEAKTFSYLKLNSVLLENIQYVFKYNKENALLNETVEDLSESLIGELKFIFFESDEEKYLNYFEKEIKVCFVEIFKNLRSDDHLKEYNDSILNLIREDHYLIKLLALKMIFSLFQELKERYITLLSNILPYVSDCLEDSNEKVHSEAFKIMKYVEKETGEDLKYYLEG